jgi:hypothetical protein
MNTSSFEFWMQRVHQLVWTRLSAGEWCMDECNSCLIAQLMSLHIRNLADPQFYVNVHLLAVFIEGSCLSGIIDAQVISMVTCEWE